MNGVGWDILLVLAMVLIGGFFAAAEMALVSLREGQVRSLGRRGRRGQRAARLAQDPNRFLSSVQIGVTLATLLSGAFGAALLADHLAAGFDHLMPHGVATPLAVVVVTLIISFFTLIFGELAPKRLALQRSERVSLLAAPVVDRVAVVATPLVWLLSRCTNLVVRLLGGDPGAGRGVMTEEELRDLVAGHQALSPDERHIVSEVFDAGRRQIREVLVPRTEVEFLPAAMSLAEAGAIAERARHSRFPVYSESYDDVIGFVHSRDLLDSRSGENSKRVGEVVRRVKFLPISKMVLSALSEMRREKAHLAIVVDEYGGTAGIVTLEDLVEELIGDIQDEYDEDATHPRQLHGGELEVDGLLNLDEFAEQTGIELPEGPYETVAGYMLAVLGRLPEGDESVQAAGRKLTVTQMDGRRISKVRVGAVGAGPVGAGPGGAAGPVGAGPVGAGPGGAGPGGAAGPSAGGAPGTANGGSGIPARPGATGGTAGASSRVVPGGAHGAGSSRGRPAN